MGVTVAVGSQWGPALPELEEAQREMGDESSEGPRPLISSFLPLSRQCCGDNLLISVLEGGEINIAADGRWKSKENSSYALISCLITCPLVTMRHY